MQKLTYFFLVIMLLGNRLPAAETEEEGEIDLPPRTWKFWATDSVERFVLASARPYLRQWQYAWKKAERIELHSISLKSDDKLPRIREHFTLVGTATIIDPVEKEQLATLLPALIYEGLNPHQPRSGCFQPHHGLSIFIGKERYDFIICFECDSIWAFPEMMPFGQQQVDSLTDDQGKMLDTILKNHQILLEQEV